MPTDFGFFSGRELLNGSHTESIPIISHLIYEQNNVLCVADVKSGKSVLSLQIACCLTTGQPFLDEYEVAQPVDVLYVQTEGSYHETQLRLQRLSKVIPFNPDKFTLYYHWGFALNVPSKFGAFIEEIQKQGLKPKIIFFDPLYTMIEGNLNDPQVTTNVVKHMRLLNDTLQCATWTNHHVRKASFDRQSGSLIAEGDQATYGSQFWRAFVDHLFVVRMNKSEKFLTLTCETQRSGEIIQKLELFMHQPDPLYFEIAEKVYPNTTNLIDYFEKNPDGASANEAMESLRISRRTFYKTLNGLTEQKMVEKIDKTWPIKFRLKQR